MEEQQQPPQTLGLIKVSTGLLESLSKGSLAMSFMPKEILVLETIVAGTSFRKVTEVERDMAVGSRLVLQREAKNEYDTFAVAFHFNEVKIGYIPRERNEAIARLMDAGKDFYASIINKEWEGNWLKITVGIYLKD